MNILISIILWALFLAAENESFKITSDFAKVALKSHNHYRTLHRVSPLKIDNAISAIATKTAQSMLNSTLKHTNKTYKGKKLGENLSMWSLSITNSSEKAGKFCSDLWYKEVSFHDFKKDYQKKSGHFSQLVWKSSTHVGFGVAISKSNVVCVGLYYPPGNVLGKFNANVFAKKK